MFIDIVNKYSLKLPEDDLNSVSKIIKSYKFIGKGTHVYTFLKNSKIVIKCVFKHDNSIFNNFIESLEDMTEKFKDYILFPTDIVYISKNIILYEQPYCELLQSINLYDLNFILEFVNIMNMRNKYFPDIYFKNFGIHNNKIKLFDFHNYENKITNFLICNLYNNINKYENPNDSIKHFNEIPYNFIPFNILKLLKKYEIILDDKSELIKIIINIINYFNFSNICIDDKCIIYHLMGTINIISNIQEYNTLFHIKSNKKIDFYININTPYKYAKNTFYLIDNYLYKHNLHDKILCKIHLYNNIYCFFKTSIY